MTKSQKLTNTPIDRALTPSDIYRFFMTQDHTRAEMSYLLGSNTQNVGKLLDKGDNNPLGNICVAILMRILLQEPTYSPLPARVSPSELYNKIVSVKPDFEKKHFGPLLGHESGSGYRWLKSNKGTSPAVDRLMMVLMLIIEEAGVDGMDFILQSVTAEASYRGVSADELWSTGKWS